MTRLFFKSYQGQWSFLIHCKMLSSLQKWNFFLEKKIKTCKLTTSKKWISSSSLWTRAESISGFWVTNCSSSTRVRLTRIWNHYQNWIKISTNKNVFAVLLRLKLASGKLKWKLQRKLLNSKFFGSRVWAPNLGRRNFVYHYAKDLILLRHLTSSG